jgi:hypothetical protein
MKNFVKPLMMSALILAFPFVYAQQAEQRQQQEIINEALHGFVEWAADACMRTMPESANMTLPEYIDASYKIKISLAQEFQHSDLLEQVTEIDAWVDTVSQEQINSRSAFEQEAFLQSKNEINLFLQFLKTSTPAQFEAVRRVVIAQIYQDWQNATQECA